MTLTLSGPEVFLVGLSLGLAAGLALLAVVELARLARSWRRGKAGW